MRWPSHSTIDRLVGQVHLDGVLQGDRIEQLDHVLHQPAHVVRLEAQRQLARPRPWRCRSGRRACARSASAGGRASAACAGCAAPAAAAHRARMLVSDSFSADSGLRRSCATPARNAICASRCAAIASARSLKWLRHRAQSHPGRSRRRARCGRRGRIGSMARDSANIGWNARVQSQNSSPAGRPTTASTLVRCPSTMPSCVPALGARARGARLRGVDVDQRLRAPRMRRRARRVTRRLSACFARGLK